MNKLIGFLFTVVVGIWGYRFFGYQEKADDKQKIEKPIPSNIISPLEVPDPKIDTPPKPVQKKKVVKKTRRPLRKVRPKKRRGITQKKGFYPIDEKGRLVLTDLMVDNDDVIFQGDILVGSRENMERRGVENIPPKISPPRPWPQGKIPYRIHPDYEFPERIKQAIDVLNKSTKVKFVPRKGEKDFVTFKVGENNCYSHLGRIGGEQFVSLSSGCYLPQILHELLHTLGLMHEQNRFDRDDYLIINWDNIDEKFHSQFMKIPAKFYPLSKKFDFDFNSIMLYGPKSFGLFPDDFTMTKINGRPYSSNISGRLSKGDIEKINDFYSTE